MKNANHGAIDNQQLLSIIERIEKLNEDAAAIAATRDMDLSIAVCEW